jgi:signal transduction histidine kinase
MMDSIWAIDARNDTLKNLIDRMQEVNVNVLSISDIDVKFTHKGLALKKSIPVDYRQNIYYIYKEAINNIAKHAGASSVDIHLDNTDHQFIMRIRDNGKGFDQAQIREGNGLKNMELRAKRNRLVNPIC